MVAVELKSPGALMRSATLFSLLAAALLITVKAAAWWMTGSLSLFSSLMDSCLDILASTVNFLAVRYSLQPPDKEHRFGHGKAEEIAALTQAGFILASGMFICVEGIKRFLHPRAVENEVIGLGVTLFALAVTVALVTYQRYVVRKTGSSVVATDSLHYFSDVLTNIAVLVALGLTYGFGWEWADPFFGLCIAAYIVYGAWMLGVKAFHNLMDHEFDEAEREQVKEIITTHPGILGYHKLKTRRAGISQFIQFHLDLNENLTLKEAHAIADGLEQRLQNAFPHTEVIVHEDPVGGIQGLPASDDNAA